MKRTAWVVAALAAGCASTTTARVSEVRPGLASRPSVEELAASLKDLLMTGFSLDTAELVEAWAPAPDASDDAPVLESSAVEVAPALDTAEIDDGLPLALDADPELQEKARELHAMFDRQFATSLN